MFLLIISILFLTSSTLATESRIVGGHPVDITDIPFIGSLQLANVNGSSHYCGCVIVSDLIILTAAHCVTSRQPESFRIRFNSSFQANGGHVVTPSKIIIHPNFNHSIYDFDIALLVLPNKLDLINYPGMKKIDLPYQHKSFEDGLTTTVCGWGVTQNVNETREQVRCGDVPLVNQIVCQNSFRSRIVTERMICAGDLVVGGIDACQGDSGGPLFERLNGQDTLVGLVSWGILCATSFYPGVYARVSYFRDWIDLNVKNEHQNYSLNH